MKKSFLFITIICSTLFKFNVYSQIKSMSDTNGRFLTITLKSVYRSNVTLYQYEGLKASNIIQKFENLKEGDSCKIFISSDYLPGEFLLRLDYENKENDTPYPAEKTIYVNNNNVDIEINPIFSNNDDSTKFNIDEKENTVYSKFKSTNFIKRNQLEIVKKFLMSYNNTHSKLYKEGIKEFELMRMEYNLWLKSQAKQYKDLFVSHLFQFNYIPSVLWNSDDGDRINQLITSFFDGINFDDSLIIRTKEFNKLMGEYMSLYGAQVTSNEERDSLFTRAGDIACYKASKGHPKVYGWMVDYFYSGYEMYNINSGLIMLQKHIDNPNCMTLKKQMIIKRINGMKNIAVGKIAPDFNLIDNENSNFNFYTYKGKTNKKLLVFWSADCSHCEELANNLNLWLSKVYNQNLCDIIAISIDDSENEIKKWENTKAMLSNFKHLRAKGGINSKISSDYSILSTPVMILVDSNYKIIGTPETIKELDFLLSN